MNFGDVVPVDFGTPVGSEAGFVRPGVLVTADAFLRFRPSTVFVVPLTQVELLRAVATERCGAPIGNVGPVVGAQLQDVLAMIVGMP